MRYGCTAAVGALVVAWGALAQPTSTDLGALSVPGTLTGNATLVAGATHWFRFTLSQDVNLSNLRFIDIDTNASLVTNNDTEIGLYRADGTRVADNDDGGNGFLSGLTFGAGSDTFLDPTELLNLSGGQNGFSLEAGTYYLAVTGYNSAFASTGFGVTGAHTRTGSIQVDIRAGTRTGLPTPPPGVIDLGALTTGTVGPRSDAVSPGTTQWYTFTIPEVSVASRRYLDIDTNTGSLPSDFDPINDTEIALYAPTGVVVAEDDDGGVNFASFLTFGLGSGANLGLPSDGADGPLSAGRYYLSVTGWNAEHEAPFAVTTDNVFAGSTGIRLTLGELGGSGAPSATSLGTLGANQTINLPADALAPAQVRWYTFTVDAPGIDRAARTFLDIQTEGSVTTDPVEPPDDTLIGLYTSTGDRVAFDDDDGSGFLSQLTFGSGFRAPVLNAAGLASGVFDGRDGATLAPGLYYLAVSGYPTTFGPVEWLVNSTAQSSGTLAGKLIRGTQPPAAPPAATDLGAINSATDGMLANDVALAPAQLLWYKFSIAQAIPLGGPEFFDVDTEGSVLSANDFGPDDTYVALYNAAGGLVVIDDDDGSGLRSQLTFGSTDARAAVGDGLPYDGRNGALPAGDYYLAVSSYAITALPTDWTAFANGITTGTIDLNFNTNIPGGPTCDGIDFNGDGVFPDLTDIVDFFFVYGGGDCPTGTCNDTDFNNDGVFPDLADVIKFLDVYGGGVC
jgi:hypothetical protein